VLATKPDQVSAALAEIRDQFTRRHLLISIAAGVTTTKLEAALPAGSRVIRVMPNTPALVGAAAAAFALGRYATRSDGQLAQRLLSAVGLAFQLKESLLDAVTGLSGSGPAYVFLVIEALTEGGVKMGLPRETALRLAAQTVFGAGKMVVETGRAPDELREAVTTPGGTTVEGLKALDAAGVRQAFIDAVAAAAEKSRRLGQK